MFIRREVVKYSSLNVRGQRSRERELQGVTRKDESQQHPLDECVCRKGMTAKGMAELTDAEGVLQARSRNQRRRNQETDVIRRHNSQVNKRN